MSQARELRKLMESRERVRELNNLALRVLAGEDDNYVPQEESLALPEIEDMPPLPPPAHAIIPTPTHHLYNPPPDQISDTTTPSPPYTDSSSPDSSPPFTPYTTCSYPDSSRSPPTRFAKGVPIPPIIYCPATSTSLEPSLYRPNRSTGSSAIWGDDEPYVGGVHMQSYARLGIRWTHELSAKMKAETDQKRAEEAELAKKEEEMKKAAEEAERAAKSTGDAEVSTSAEPEGKSKDKRKKLRKQKEEQKDRVKKEKKSFFDWLKGLGRKLG